MLPTPTPLRKRTCFDNTQRQNILDWEYILGIYHIFDSVCSYLEPPDLFALQRTTKRLSKSFETLYKTQWNINRLIRRFVSDPVRLRSEMAKYDAVISGSVALQFFDRVVWKESDLDIYVRGKENTTAFIEYFSRSEGYTLGKAKDDCDYEEDGQAIIRVISPPILESQINK